MAGKRRVPKGKADQLEQGCANCCGKYCRFSKYTNALICAGMFVWIALLVLWFGGSYIAGKVKSATATSCTPNPGVAIGTGGNPYIWWATTSGIIIFITLASTCLCCCSFVGLCCGGLPNAVIYVSAVGVVISLLGYTLMLAWVAVGTYLAVEVKEVTGENCISYHVYLAFFYAFILVLVLFAVISLVWKLRNPVKENLLAKIPKV